MWDSIFEETTNQPLPPKLLEGSAKNINAEKCEPGDYFYFGENNDFKAIVASTKKGNRFVIYHKNKPIVESPVHKYSGDVKQFYDKSLKSNPNYPEGKQAQQKTEADVKAKKDEKLLEDAAKREAEIQAEKAEKEQHIKDLSDEAAFIARTHGITYIEALEKIQKDPEQVSDFMKQKYGIDGNYIAPYGVYNSVYERLSMYDTQKELPEGAKKLQERRKESAELLTGIPEQDSLDDAKFAESLGTKGSPISQDAYADAVNTGVKQPTPFDVATAGIDRGIGEVEEQGQKNTFALAPFLKPFDEKRDTFQEATDIFNNMENERGYQYSSAEPYNQADHNYAISGHGQGSSSYMINDAKRQQKMNSERLDAIGKIQSMLSNNIGDQEKIADIIRAAGQGSLESLGAGPSMRSNDLVPSITARNDAVGRKSDKIFEAGRENMGADTKTISEMLGINQSEFGQKKSLMDDNVNLGNSINNYLLLSNDANRRGAIDTQRFRQAQIDIWARREEIRLAIEKLANERNDKELERRAKELENKQNNMTEWFKVFATVAHVAVKAAGVI
ncbi:MAG: hypothetical protein AAGE99_04680 [Chlamydiota bacterium]